MENKILIIYKSSTGFTKKYAEMAASEVKCTLARYETITPGIIQKHNIIVFGTRAHAGMIDGYKKIKKLIEKNSTGKFIIFVTGATPNTAENIINNFWEQNLSANELLKIPHFYMQSGLCYEKMSLSDKLMMKVAKIMIKNKKNKTSYERKLEQTVKNSYDISSRKYVEPLVLFLKNNC